MEIQIKQEAGIIVVEVIGKLDAMTFTMLENVFHDLSKKNVTQILLDCDKLDYISSSGLRVLLMELKRINSLNGKLYLCNLQPKVREIFEISGFKTIFMIFSDKDKAIDSFK